jgi:hypothetical protein
MPAIPKPARPFKVHGPVPVQSGSPRATLIRVATALCARIVKRRDGRCLFKGLVPDVPCWGPLEAAHIWTKGSHPAVRFEPDAIVSACHQHHAWGGAHDTAWRTLCRRIVGAARFDAMGARSHVPGRCRIR